MPRHQTQHRHFTVLMTGLLAGALVLTPAVPVAAAGAATATASLSVRPPTVHRGDAVTIAGLIPTSGPQACPAADQATLTSTAALFPPDGFGPTVSRNSSGHFQVVYRVPSSTTRGSYQIGVRCGGGNVGVSATLRVR